MWYHIHKSCISPKDYSFLIEKFCTHFIRFLLGLLIMLKAQMKDFNWVYYHKFSIDWTCMCINIAMRCFQSHMARTAVLFMRNLWQNNISSCSLFHGWPCLYVKLPLSCMMWSKYSAMGLELNGLLTVHMPILPNPQEMTRLALHEESFLLPFQMVIMIPKSQTWPNACQLEIPQPNVYGFLGEIAWRCDCGEKLGFHRELNIYSVLQRSVSLKGHFLTVW